MDEPEVDLVDMVNDAPEIGRHVNVKGDTTARITAGAGSGGGGSRVGRDGSDHTSHGETRLDGEDFNVINFEDVEDEQDRDEGEEVDAKARPPTSGKRGIGFGAGEEEGQKARERTSKEEYHGGDHEDKIKDVQQEREEEEEEEEEIEENDDDYETEEDDDEEGGEQNYYNNDDKDDDDDEEDDDFPWRGPGGLFGARLFQAHKASSRAQDASKGPLDDLHPFAQALSMANVDDCVELEEAVYAEGKRASREQVWM